MHLVGIFLLSKSIASLLSYTLRCNFTGNMLAEATCLTAATACFPSESFLFPLSFGILIDCKEYLDKIRRSLECLSLLLLLPLAQLHFCSYAILPMCQLHYCQWLSCIIADDPSVSLPMSHVSIAVSYPL